MKKEKSISISIKIQYFLGFLFFLTIEILIALFVHDNFIRPYVGDILVIFVMYFFVRIFIPEKYTWLPFILFIFATGVEICQFFHVVEYIGLSDNRFMRILLGSTFDRKDILCYGVGSIMLQTGVWLKSKK